MKLEDFIQYGINIPTEGKLIIDLYTEWCAPCKLLSRILENLKNQGIINVISINIDENRDFGLKLNVQVVPTLLFFKDGKLLDKNIEIIGETMVKNGVMIGATGELVLQKIIEKM